MPGKLPKNAQQTSRPRAPENPKPVSSVQKRPMPCLLSCEKEYVSHYSDLSMRQRHHKRAFSTDKKASTQHLRARDVRDDARNMEDDARAVHPYTRTRHPNARDRQANARQDVAQG